MRTSMIVTAIVMGTLGGCASVPPIGEEHYVKVSDILYTTECELKEAVDALRPQVNKLGEQVMKATYTLAVEETGKGTGSAGLVVPISNGTFSIGLEAGHTQVNTRTTSFTVEYEAHRLRCDADGGPGAAQRIAGSLGLSEWLLKTSGALSGADETPIAMTYQVDFDVVSNAALKPAVGVTLPSGHKYGAEFAVSGVRKTKNSILVAAAKIDVSAGGDAQAKRNLDIAIQQFLLRKSD